MTREIDQGKTRPRRETLREKLILAAESIIREKGLEALKARDVAGKAGCALGAIYTAFEDIDELILSVNLRSLADLEAALRRAGGETAAEKLLALAKAYLAFARGEETRWRALFQHRLPAGRDVPQWYADARERLFVLLGEPVSALFDNEPAERRTLLSRMLFSAVHGVVSLGMEEKLAPTSAETLNRQIEILVELVIRGAARAPVQNVEPVPVVKV